MENYFKIKKRYLNRLLRRVNNLKKKFYEIQSGGTVEEVLEANRKYKQSIEEKIKKLEEYIDELHEKDAEEDKYIQKLEAHIDTKNSEIASNIVSLRNVTEELERLKNKMLQLTETNTTERKQLEDMIVSKETEISAFFNEKTILTQKIQELEGKLLSATTGHFELVQQLKDRITALEQQISSLKFDPVDSTTDRIKAISRRTQKLLS